MSDAERLFRTHILIITKQHCVVWSKIQEKTMTAKKIIMTAALLLSATSTALAQSAWTTGSASDRERAGYPSPFGSSLYAYAPNVAPRDASGLSAFAMVPQAPAGSIDNPTLTGGGSTGYNQLERQDR